jgi:hypothetical protein
MSTITIKDLCIAIQSKDEDRIYAELTRSNSNYSFFKNTLNFVKATDQVLWMNLSIDLIRDKDQPDAIIDCWSDDELLYLMQYALETNYVSLLDHIQYKSSVHRFSDLLVKMYQQNQKK